MKRKNYPLTSHLSPLTSKNHLSPLTSKKPMRRKKNTLIVIFNIKSVIYSEYICIFVACY